MDEEPGGRLAIRIPGRASASLPSIPSGLPGATSRPRVRSQAASMTAPAGTSSEPTSARWQRPAARAPAPFADPSVSATARPPNRGGELFEQGVGRARHEQRRLDPCERAEQLDVDLLTGGDSPRADRTRRDRRRVRAS